MSTFGGLNTAFLGLTAARQGINLAGQNIANAGTEGYTRQRIEQSPIGAPSASGLTAPGVRPGQGVSVDGISRLGNSFLDAGVRSTAAQAGFTSIRSTELQRIEETLQEPGENGITTALQDFWGAWQGVSNHPGESAPAAVLLQAATTLAGKVSAGYRAIDAQWTQVRSEAAANTATVNDAAAQVAGYNATIRSVLAGGGSANELIDARNSAIETIAALAGGTVRENADGTADVLIGGNALVSGSSYRTLSLGGQTTITGAGTAVQVEWSDRPGNPAGLDGGRIAGAVSLLSPAAGGAGGAIAEAAASYDSFASELAAKVNAVHRTGQSTTGAANLDFFASAPGGSPAMSLRVVPRDAAGIATGAAVAGTLDGSVADSLAQLGTSATSPDKAWAAVVTGIGVLSRSAQQHEQLSAAASVSARGHRDSGASVSLDEENISLLTNQHAYQAAARVMTAVDEALDVLINRTGLVGR
ncbi:flagellar hook-associated protein FlgK [Pseudarthrobacter chlorophenolicus A6]|uniref:Flagellar hook-associated protein 1 n=1 Tax=Pseudarthrobacter chlorophenolicus (strain ATCC 700700 / DSM 12829 / CIP 107037 / JCM 12360 / KCTC 9906 / NCIMB 13794 / A6) TaxID=452863 RepID=B8HEL6_PSECP|nr:flagellar hook-associated protein FlgK [Pseudarthrobacter chlorophenolicus]ACL40961.1 flagellar hook-associated protein FlgK [Pseudarthrobacter chlorophenolicus A6]SDQ72178.1 flagellar hook-associated protein 1 FlgK [Pseudarthrobacter chlorophenolicus]